MVNGVDSGSSRYMSLEFYLFIYFWVYESRFTNNLKTVFEN